MFTQQRAVFLPSRTLCSRIRALALFVISANLSGCALWLVDEDPYGAPPEPVYVAPPEPVYVAPVDVEYYTPPGVYYYTPAPYPMYAPAPYFRGQTPENSDEQKTSSDARVQRTTQSSYLTRGQSDDSEAFPSLDDSFPSFDEQVAPPESSELSDFARNGAEVPEPSGVYETLDYSEESFLPQPKRESLAELEKTEEKIESNFNAWLREKKDRNRSSGKTKRYLQPLQDSDAGLFDREERRAKKSDDGEIIETVTLAGLEMMLENDESKRELYDWEKDAPTPIDWSKYSASLDNIRAWFGMGPDERAALEYMRQACNKQKEYEKTRDKKTLREAAKLYEKAAERWPGPALRPEYARKHPFNAPKSGALIEEDGLFFAGECWFFSREFTRALTCYRALVTTYNSSIYKSIAMRRLFYIGQYWVECSEEATGPSVNVKDKDKPVFSTFKGAEKAFSTIFLNDASDNGLAPEALFALANAYMRRGVKQGDGSFDSAARYYKQLYEFYPGSKRAEDACRLAMIALHKSYQGVFYDDAPLNEARALAETILKSGRGNMDVIYEELENIKDEQAHRLFALGGYYEKRGNYASARAYYNRLAKEYPNSDYAVEGARRYQIIVDKPAEVDQLAWARTVMPFLPKSKNEYFEEVPTEDLARIARRDESLDRIGSTSESEDSNPLTANAPGEKSRY